LNKKTVFRGWGEIRGSYASPTVMVGKCTNFIDGSDRETSKVTKALLKHKEVEFEWSGQYSFFTNHVG
jgi:hypothetical protein